MQEESQAFSKRCEVCQRRDSIGVHQVGDAVWLCERCFRAREKDKAAPFVDWSTKETIDSLTESMHYFTELYRNRKYRTFELVDRIKGSKGVICNVMEMVRDAKDPLGMPWTRYHRYYQLFNRRYLERGDQVYERASMFHGPWQTVHRTVVQRAAVENVKGMYKDNVTLVVVMQNKTVWYIDPSKLHWFSFEYETYNEREGGVSVPISKEQIINRVDPFFS